MVPFRGVQFQIRRRTREKRVHSSSIIDDSSRGTNLLCTTSICSDSHLLKRSFLFYIYGVIGICTDLKYQSMPITKLTNNRKKHLNSLTFIPLSSVFYIAATRFQLIFQLQTQNKRIDWCFQEQNFNNHLSSL